MNDISFLHTHYLPAKLLNEIEIKTSVVALEVYPDLLLKYYGKYDIFESLEECIEWHNIQFIGKDIKFTIENIALLKDISSLERAKLLGLVSVQLYHSQSNAYFNHKLGITKLGVQLLKKLYDYDIFLDLSHMDDEAIASILRLYPGKIINSHCVCSEIIDTVHPRTNVVTSDTIKRLAERNCLFGIPFVNDIVSKLSHDTGENDDGIINDIVSQIIFFVKVSGAENVALGPDFMDVEYFSRVYKQKIKIPNIFYSELGYQRLFVELRNKSISEHDIGLIMGGNVRRVINFACKSL